jgi:hypothetical protein
MHANSIPCLWNSLLACGFDGWYLRLPRLAMCNFSCFLAPRRHVDGDRFLASREDVLDGVSVLTEASAAIL